MIVDPADVERVRGVRTLIYIVSGNAEVCSTVLCKLAFTDGAL